MKKVYGALLRLYPRHYRDLSGEEALGVFEQAVHEHKTRGFAVYAWFLLLELCGALAGAAREWNARMSAPGAGRSTACAGDRLIRSCGPLGEAQNRIESNLKSMTDAIANHDFVAARACYVEDLKARADLRSLRDRLGFEE